MLVGNTIVLTTSYDPILYWGSPWHAEWFAETWYPGDDVVGSASSPAYFSQLGIQTCRSCALATPGALTMLSTNPRYRFATDSASRFHVYTK